MNVVCTMPLIFGCNITEEQANGTHTDKVRAHCSAASKVAGQCQSLEPVRVPMPFSKWPGTAATGVACLSVSGSAAT